MGGNNSFIYIAFFTVVVLLGVNFVAVKFSNMELPPFWGAALRFVIASSILFTIVKIKKIPLPTQKALFGAGLFGILSFGLTYGLLYQALLTVSSSVTSVIFATLPLVTLFIASIIGLEKITLKGVVGAIIVISGILFVFNNQFSFNIPLIPLILIFLGVVSAALSGIVVKYFPKTHPVSLNAVAMGVGALALFVTSLFFGEGITLPTLTTTYYALGWLITSSILSFILLVWIIGKWNASRASYALVLSPLVTTVTAAILIGETVTLSFLVGTFIVLFGVYIGALSQTSKKPK